MLTLALAPTRPTTHENILQQMKATPPGLRWVALIDTLSDYQKTPFPLPEDSLNCYAVAGQLATLKPVAPWLVPLHRASAPEQLAALIAHCDARPMLSFIVLPEDFELEALVDQWKTLHWVTPREGKKMLLRFADTRTLAILPKVLTPEQWRGWSENLAQWHLIGRNGALEKLPLPGADIKPKKKLDFDDAQLARMLELNEPDTALGSLLQWSPEALPENLTGYRYYELSTGALEQANQHKVEDWGERLTLICLAAVTDGKMLDDVEMNQWLAAHAWGKGQFSDAIAETPWYQRMLQQ